MKTLFPAVLLLALPASAAEIVLPSTVLERQGSVAAVYRTGPLATGKGELSLKWTDSYGRLVEDRKMPVQLEDESEIAFSLPVYRALAMKNNLRAHLSFEGVNKKGDRDHREEDATLDFIAKPPAREWWDYTVIMWQQRTREQMAALKKAGVNAGESVARGHSIPAFLLDNNMRWYAENIATDFYSEYHRWFPDRRVNWKFVETREQYKKDRTSKEPLKRHPSLSDPVWLAAIRDRLVSSAQFYSPYRPVFYSLGDETGIADLAAFWDFDFSDESLAGMRKWLRQRYGTLQALNSQWGTQFRSWDSVIPQTTDEAMKDARENYSSWGDFKEWMDVAYSAALKMGNDAIRSVDPDAYVGIGGGQMPGWGGYDYSRITKALTAIEPYDIGNNIEIIRSLNPGMAVTTTSFKTGPWEQHRVWYEMLHGNRGLIIWDDKSEFVTADNQLGPRAHEVVPYYTELRNGIAAQLIGSERITGPIAIHYSQPSMRVEWMLAQRPKGENWVTRNSSTEYRDSDFLRLRESYCRLIEDEGLQYRFVSYGQVEDGELLNGGYKVIILPRSTALSAREAAALREFAARGGTIIADGEPGLFDEHGKRLDKGQLADLFAATPGNNTFASHSAGRGRAVLLNTPVLNYHQYRLVNKEGPIHALFADLLRTAGVQPAIAVTGPGGKPMVGIEAHTFRNGGATILAIMTNPQLRVDELGPPEFRSNERFAKPMSVQVALPRDSFVYDMRAGKALGRKREMSVTVQPYEPSIYSISPEEFPALELSVPERVERGHDASVSIGPGSSSVASMHVMHVDVINPAGETIEWLSGNIRAHRGRGIKVLPIAQNDAPGRYEVRVRDLLSGSTRIAAFEVY